MTRRTMAFIFSIVTLGFTQGFVQPEGSARLAPRLLNYQGYLTDTLNNPINNPSLSITFAVFDAASAGNQKWSETQSVSVSKGVFSVLLGTVTPIPDSVFTLSASRWLQLTVGALALAPRTRIVSAPYAYTAAYSDTAAYARAGQMTGAAGGDLTGNYPNPHIAPDSVTTSQILNGTILGADVNLPCTLSHAVSSNALLRLRNNSVLGHGLMVNSAGWNAVQIDSAGHNGVYIAYADTAIKIITGGDYGIFMDSIDGNGIRIEQSTSNGYFVNRGGGDGFRGYRISGDGVDIDSAGDNGVRINRADLNGVYVGSSIRDAFYVNTTDSHGVHVRRSGQAGIYIEAPGTDGVYIDSATDDGIQINKALDNGIWMSNVNRGVYVSKSSLYGVWADCSTGTAVYGVSDDFRGGYFRNNNNDYYAATAYNGTGTGATVRGLYIQGHGYASGGWQTFLAEGGETGFSVVSPDLEIMVSGSASLRLGTAAVDFEPGVREALSGGVPLRVIVTPTSRCNGLCVASKSAAGFTVEELQGGKSGATFDWIAIGRIKGYEQRVKTGPPDPGRLEE